MLLKERYKIFIDRCRARMPEPETELRYRNPFELMVAVILSAQCTDKRVNMVTPQLFERFPDAISLAAASEEELFPYISSVTFPNNKTRHLIRAARMLVEKYAGSPPADFDELVKLPGVGRKTANVLLSVVWNKSAMAVDTHVFRVSNRLGLTHDSKTPLQTEKTLVRHIPAEILPKAHHWLILHGRYVCKARNPLCSECFLSDICLTHNSSKK